MIVGNRAGLVPIMALFLVACSPGPTAGFRDAQAPIGSTTRFDPAHFAGDWHVVARFAQVGDPAGAAAETLQISPDGAVLRGREVCVDGACALREARSRLEMAGPGRFVLDGVAHWVLWVDADYRTAVIGTPSGAFGWIMEKGAKATPPDRLEAAREILAWAGYDLARLTEVRR